MYYEMQTSKFREKYFRIISEFQSDLNGSKTPRNKDTSK